MTFWDDDRGASVQVGAIILFGFLVLAIAGWQAQVVPQDNAEIEHTHRQRVTDDMQDVRNEIVSAPGETAMRSVAVEMAPEYPPRTLFVNPAQPSGTLRTVGTTDEGVNVTIENARANDGEEADYWNGSVHAYNTGGIVYEPGYNVYHGAPDTVYENSVLYNVHDAETNVTVTGQELIEGRTISLVTLNGSVDRSSAGVYTVDARVLSSSTRTVAVNNSASANITISFASMRAPSSWEQQLHDANEFVGDGEGGHVVDVRRGTPTGGQYHNVTIELEGDTTYQLQMARVGVGARTDETGTAYVVDVAGNQSTISRGGTQKLVVEVRDRYNNPVDSASVDGTASMGDLTAKPTSRTGDDGRVTFIYEAPVDETGDVDVNVTVASGVDPAASGFDPGTPKNLTMDLTVGGSAGGSSFATIWKDPSGQNGVTYDAGRELYVVNASKTSKATLTAETNSTAVNATIDFALNNTDAGTLTTYEETTNDPSGEASTTFQLESNGFVKAYASGGGSGDVIDMKVENFGSGNDPPVASIDSVQDNSKCNGNNCKNSDLASFDVDWSATDDSGIDTVTVELINETTGSVVDTAAPAASGTSASGTVTLEEAGGYGGDYRIRLTVTDTAGASDTAETTQAADGDDTT